MKIPVEDLLKTVDDDLYEMRGSRRVKRLVVDFYHPYKLFSPADVQTPYWMEVAPRAGQFSDENEYVLASAVLEETGFFGIGRWLTKGYRQVDVAVTSEQDRLALYHLYPDAQMLAVDEIAVPNVVIRRKEIEERVRAVRPHFQREIEEERVLLQKRRLERLIKRRQRQRRIAV